SPRGQDVRLPRMVVELLELSNDPSSRHGAVIDTLKEQRAERVAVDARNRPGLAMVMYRRPLARRHHRRMDREQKLRIPVEKTRLVVAGDRQRVVSLEEDGALQQPLEVKLHCMKQLCHRG